MKYFQRKSASSAGNKLRLLIILSTLLVSSLFSQDFQLARLHYGGGGDWYANPSSLPNLIKFVNQETTLKLDSQEARVKLSDGNLYDYPFLYLTGHGNIKFTNDEVHRLRDYLTQGGFLHADDNYGLDESFRREMKKVFPNKEWVELPPSHPIFSSHFNFPNGLPKIHEHDGKRPQALGLFHNGKLVVLYTYESDLGDGWEDLEVHKDGIAKHLIALKMGANILTYCFMP